MIYSNAFLATSTSTSTVSSPSKHTESSRPTCYTSTLPVIHSNHYYYNYNYNHNLIHSKHDIIPPTATSNPTTTTSYSTTNVDSETAFECVSPQPTLLGAGGIDLLEASPPPEFTPLLSPIIPTQSQSQTSIPILLKTNIPSWSTPSPRAGGNRCLPLQSDTHVTFQAITPKPISCATLPPSPSTLAPPIRCPWATCSRSFLKQSTFQSHYNEHTHARPHACATCGSSFTRRHDYLRHVKTVHAGGGIMANEALPVCRVCTKSFSRIDSLKRHEKRCK